MLDGWARRKIDPPVRALAHVIVRMGISANAVTIAGCGIGLLAMGAIAVELFWLGLALLLISRLADGLDGAVAALTRKTDYGGFLDIVLDFVFYGAIPLGFIIADPAANGLAGAVLIFSFYVNGASFLAFAIFAERHQMTTADRGTKSLYFTTGLAEATETLVVFLLACLFPGWFAILAYVFAAICFYTALSRIVLAGRVFAEPGDR